MTNIEIHSFSYRAVHKKYALLLYLQLRESYNPSHSVALHSFPLRPACQGPSHRTFEACLRKGKVRRKYLVLIFYRSIIHFLFIFTYATQKGR